MSPILGVFILIFLNCSVFVLILVTYIWIHKYKNSNLSMNSYFTHNLPKPLYVYYILCAKIYLAPDDNIVIVWQKLS